MAISPILSNFQQNFNISLCPSMTLIFRTRTLRAISSSLSWLLPTKFWSTSDQLFNHNCLWDITVLDLLFSVESCKRLILRKSLFYTLFAKHFKLQELLIPFLRFRIRTGRNAFAEKVHVLLPRTVVSSCIYSTFICIL